MQILCFYHKNIFTKYNNSSQQEELPHEEETGFVWCPSHPSLERPERCQKELTNTSSIHNTCTSFAWLKPK